MQDIALAAGTVPGVECDQAAYVAGLHALRGDDLARAVPLLQHAAAAQPQNQARRRNAIRALLAAAHHTAAVQAARDALQLWPDDPELLFAYGSALSETNNLPAALAALRRAWQLRPRHAPSCLNLANCHADLDELDTAEALCRHALELDASLMEAHASLGTILTRQGRLPEALDAFAAALALQPDDPQANWNRAAALLLAGDFQAGFAAFEWRRRHPSFARWLTPLPGPEWTPAWLNSHPAGGPVLDGTVPGRGAPPHTVLVRAEQGAGDVIQFARYLPLLQARHVCPILCCAPNLLRLLRESLPGVMVTDGLSPLKPDGPWANRPSRSNSLSDRAGQSPGGPASSHHALTYDAWVNLGSLPALFGTRPDTIPAPQGYLSASPARAQAWRSRLSAQVPSGGRRVGLCFAGNPAHTGDRRRSVPPELLTPLLSVPGIRFINLQHGPSAAALPLPDLTPALTDYAETAALITTLDLVITVDTSVAHLAGALGVPAWIMLPFAPDWRWMLQRTDTPWYRSVRLFRQPAPGAWAEVIARIILDLGDLSFTCSA